MSTDRDTTRAVRSWLREGTNQLPDRVLDAVLDELPTTRQRRARWKIWRFPVMNSAVPIALATAAVMMLAILGVTTVSPGPNVGGLMQPSAPNPSESPRALPSHSTDLAPGRYVIDDPFPVRITFDVPQGWTSCRYGSVELGVCAAEFRGIALLIVDNVVADPCDASSALDPPVGPSVDDLVTAISALSGFEVTEPIDVTVDGFSGQQFELTAPDHAPCDLATWSTVDRTNGVSLGEVNLLRILDVDGVRVMIAAAHQPAQTSQQQLDELRQVFDSVRIEP